MKFLRGTKGNDIDVTLETLIIQLLMQDQDGKCAECGEELLYFQVHHKRYGLDITLKDLALLCSPCHAAHRTDGKDTRATGKMKKRYQAL